MPAPEDLQYVRDLIYALENTNHIDGTGGVDHQKVRGYGLQPDGNLVGQRATGELFNYEMALDAHETFTSEWFDTDGFSSIEVFVDADASSVPNGVRLQFTDNVQAETPEVESETIKTYDEIDVTRGYRFYKTDTNLDGFRLVYENNSDPTNFQAIGTARTTLSLDGAEYVDQNDLGENQIQIGTNPNAQGLKIGDPSSLFGDVVTIERTTLIDISSSFGTSTVTDELFTSGSGAITQDPDPDTGELALDPGTTADSSVELRTAEYGRYTPGYSAQMGIGIRLPNPPTDPESEARWGYFDKNNGFYWGYDGDREELFVARRSNGVEAEKVYRSDWNRNVVGDIIDRDITVDEGNIFQIDFSWYGYGIIQFSIVTQSADDLRTDTPAQKTITVHSISVTGETSTTDPNQPITVEAENGTAGESYEVRIGGRQFSVFGDAPSGNRNTAETVFDTTIDQGTWTHIMSWRRKVGIGGAEPNARLNMDGMNFAIDQTSKYALVINGDVTGFTWTTPDLTNPDETLLEVSTAGTFNGLNGGTKIWEGSARVSGTGQAQTNVSPNVNLNLGQNNVVSLVALADGKVGSATTTMRMKEDW